MYCIYLFFKDLLLKKNLVVLCNLPWLISILQFYKFPSKQMHIQSQLQKNLEKGIKYVQS